MSSHEAIVIVGMLLTLSAVLLLELRYMRSRRKRRDTEAELPDRAHNAILTTKAISEALARGGVRSSDADDLVREAEAAMKERHFRVAIELAEKAKGVLRTAKLRHEQRGDLAKLEEIADKKSKDEDAVTEKERLMKELPPNYMQAKFSMNIAGDDIAAAKAHGRDTGEAERHLANAQASFQEHDYETALKHAVRAGRSLDEPSVAPADAAPAPTPTPVAAPVSTAKTRVCQSCGAPVAADDAFCRKCGVGVRGPRTCPSCGADVADEDAFCRKCGTQVP